MGTRVDGRTVDAVHQLGSEPTVVLLHGSGATHHLWDAVVAELEGIKVLAPSLPGRLESEGPPLATAVAMAAWLERLLEALGVGEAVLVGHSLGGGVGLELAFRDLDAARRRVRGLGLVASGARLRVRPDLLAALEVSAAVEDAGGPEEVPAGTALADWRAADGFDRLHQMERIEVPAFALGGTADLFTPARYATYLAEHLPNATLTLLEGAGHDLPSERPSAVAEEIRALLARLA